MSWGKRPYVVKFPLSYPSRGLSLRVDGAAGWGGLKCLHELASSSISDGRIKAADRRWEGSRDGVKWAAVWELQNLWGKPPLCVHLALTADDTLHIAAVADWRKLLASLREGEWTEPITVRAEGRRGISDFCFRVKALKLSAGGIRLFNTAVHERLNHSEPAHIWERLIEQAGPIEEQTDPSHVFSSDLDLVTQMELFNLNVEWLQKIAIAILEGEPWDLFMIQAHFVDWAHHLLHGAIDFRHPDFVRETAPKYQRMLLDAYSMADELVRTVVERLTPQDNLVVVSDHGQDIHHTTFHVNQWLAAEGYLSWRDGGDEVDWERSRAYATGNYIYLNVEGREPHGIVPPAHARTLADELSGRLLALSDPSTGELPIAFADQKKRLQHLGADGPGVGDVVFCMIPGYQARNNRAPMFQPTRLFREFTSGHDHFSPLHREIHSRLYAAGPGFRRGATSELAHVCDVAPTVAAALHIPPPPQSQGRAIQAALATPPEVPF
jgi:hypothetical protein